MSVDTIPLRPAPSAETDPSPALRDRPALTVEPIAVGRKQGAALFGIGVATWDRWDASGQLGPIGIRKSGRKLWILSELRAWAVAGMPPRKEWLAVQSASRNGRK